jgi:hypothetical protein
MPCRRVTLPAQQARANTYLGRALGVRDLLHYLARSSTEDKASAIMNGILTDVSPPNQGYVAGPETRQAA